MNTNRIVERVLEAADGTPLVQRIQGHGPAVVIVHGVLADACQWDEVAGALAQRGRRVVVPHRRGRAPSGPLGPDYDLRTEVHDLRCILDEVGPGACLVGHSYGGVIALHAAMQREDLGRLVVYEPLLDPRSFGGPPLAKAQALAARGDLEGAMLVLVTEISPTPPELLPAYRASGLWQSQLRFVRAAIAEIAATERALPRSPDWSSLRVPPRVLLGALNEGHEPFGPSAVALAESIPGARLVRLEGQRHLAHVDAPARLASAILA
ncbi:alpha/beta hydrolase [Pendulispora brunnea]|uniref:Alpha/beta hydrolase n=1 Tax=Pendulispora brunnea TaxID=2905690 RepID=A0ABZ2K9T1_9BACT